MAWAKHAGIGPVASCQLRDSIMSCRVPEAASETIACLSRAYFMGRFPTARGRLKVSDSWSCAIHGGRFEMTISWRPQSYITSTQLLKIGFQGSFKQSRQAVFFKNMMQKDSRTPISQSGLHTHPRNSLRD